MISEELLNNIEHELNSITGLYASDNPEFNESFQLDFSELLEKIEKEKHSMCMLSNKLIFLSYPTISIRIFNMSVVISSF